MNTTDQSNPLVHEDMVHGTMLSCDAPPTCLSTPPKNNDTIFARVTLPARLPFHGKPSIACDAMKGLVDIPSNHDDAEPARVMTPEMLPIVPQATPLISSGTAGKPPTFGAPPNVHGLLPIRQKPVNQPVILPKQLAMVDEGMKLLLAMLARPDINFCPFYIAKTRHKRGMIRNDAMNPSLYISCLGIERSSDGNVYAIPPSML